jgi:hypothetical protein
VKAVDAVAKRVAWKRSAADILSKAVLLNQAWTLSGVILELRAMREAVSATTQIPTSAAAAIRKGRKRRLFTRPA